MHIKAHRDPQCTQYLKSVMMLAAPKDKFSDLLATTTVIVEGSCVQNVLELCLSTVCLEQTGDVFAAHCQ